MIKICLENILSDSNFIILYPQLFSTLKNCETSFSTQGNSIKPSHQKHRYGKHSVVVTIV